MKTLLKTSIFLLILVMASCQKQEITYTWECEMIVYDNSYLPARLDTLDAEIYHDKTPDEIRKLIISSSNNVQVLNCKRVNL